MSNMEGYPDRTAETAISRVAKQEKLKSRKGGKKANGNERCTKTTESPKIRQHKA